MKGIDPRARARAKTAARREGMTLGEWLNRVILDESDPGSPRWDDALEAFPGFGGEVPASPEEDRLMRAMVNRLTERVDNTEQLSGKALTGLDKAISQLADKISNSDTRLQSQLAEARKTIDTMRSGQTALNDRIDSLEAKGPANSVPEDFAKAAENTVGKIARRLYEHENDIAARMHDSESAMRDMSDATRKAAQSLEHRIDRLENRASDYADLTKRRDARTAETLGELHRTTNALRERLEGSERLSSDGARTLETSVARIEERLRGLENRNEGDNVELERRFDRLSDDVARVVADTRSKMSSALSGAASGNRVDRLEATLAQALERMDRSDQRQTESMSRLGEEITRLAGAIDRRMTEAETRAAKDRSEDQFEKRLDEVRRENRDNLRRMGEQVTRLGTSLADRISRGEDNASKAIEDATSRMADAVERIETARVSREDELDDRLRQSEERTAQRIEDAMAGIQDKLSSAKSETEEALSPVQRAMTALAERLETIENGTSGEDDETDGDESGASGDGSVKNQDSKIDPSGFDFDAPLAPPPEAETPMTGVETGESDPFLEPAPEPVDAPILRAPQPAPQPTPQAAAQPAAQPRQAIAPTAQPVAAKTIERPAPAQVTPRRVGATADTEFLAAARERTRVEGTDFEGSSRRRRARRGSLFLTLIPIAVVLSIGTAGTIAYLDSRDTGSSQQVSESDFVATVSGAFSSETAEEIAPESTPNIAPGASPGDAALAAETAIAAPVQTAPALPAPEPVEIAAVQPPAVDSTPVATEPALLSTPPSNQVADASNTILPPAANPAPASTQTAANTSGNRTTLERAASDGNPVAQYQLGMRQLEAGDFTRAAASLRAAAEQGIPAAQYRYAKLLETGDGIEQDLEAARRWTERAANSGHVRAMHNLGVIHYYGAGGSQNLEAAARWFQEAALMGSRDSQFNLALMFEQGEGVPLSLPDAFAWYTIAATENDPTASQRAANLIELIEPAALIEARLTAGNFAPRAANAEANGVYTNQPWDRTVTVAPEAVRRAQAFLSVLGYAPGPIDGQMGTQTREAIMSFEADQGLPRSGRVDAVLIERLERAAAD